ncbi:MAG: hypothetical protein ACOY32_00055 [Thermodesulfobacteriota bacterium]
MEVYRTPFFAKQLAALSRSDRKGALAGARVEEIVNHLARTDVDRFVLKNKRTRHGELRVRGCVKYDLGGGYRLICLKKDNAIYLLYTGTHDECDRWLNNRRGTKLEIETAAFVFIDAVGADDSDLAEGGSEAAEPDEYEQILAARLDDRILRQVFGGICRQ